MLEIRNKEYFNKVTEFAAKTGQAEHLFKQLLWLHRFSDQELENLPFASKTLTEESPVAYTRSSPPTATPVRLWENCC